MTIDTTASAFIAGLITSLHCVGMCGPIACSWAMRQPGTKSTFLRDTGLYHGARLASYTVVGTLAGLLGVMPMKTFQHGPAAVLPWLLVALFIIVAFGLERWIPKPKFLAMPMARIKLRALRLSGASRGLLLGAATPLLPCGPLYLMFGLAMATGSAGQGGQFALAFGLGTLPLLWLAQSQVQLLQLKLSPRTLVYVQRGFALCAALIMVWRLRGVFTGEPEASCCHS